MIHRVTMAYLVAVIRAGYMPTDAEIMYLDRFVRDLHGFYNPSYPTENIFGKFKAIYPFFGGTADTHAINLVDPAQFVITWHGSPTHTAAGVIFAGGIGQWGNTHLNVTNDLSADSRTYVTFTDNHISPWFLFGVYDGAKCDYMRVNAYSQTVTQYSISTDPFPAPGTNGLDMGQVKAISLTGDVQKLYGSGTLRDTSTNTRTPPNGNMYLGALNDVDNIYDWVNTDEGTFAWLGAGHRMAFFAAGAAITDDEQSALNTAIKTLQDSLGRAYYVYYPE